MRVHWILPIVCEDDSEVDFTRISEATVLPIHADVVELDGEARFSVTVGWVMPQTSAPLVRFMPHRATPRQIGWLRSNGWVEE